MNTLLLGQNIFNPEKTKMKWDLGPSPWELVSPEGSAGSGQRSQLGLCGRLAPQGPPRGSPSGWSPRTCEALSCLTGLYASGSECH